MLKMATLTVTMFLLAQGSIALYGETICYPSGKVMKEDYFHNHLHIKYMRKCHITIDGQGYSSWLTGLKIDNKTFISIAIISLKEGSTKVYSIDNPIENYTFTGKQIVLMRRFIGYYHSDLEYDPPLTFYNGTALNALIISTK